MSSEDAGPQHLSFLASVRDAVRISVSHALNVFANESFIDEMAMAAGKDPYAFRLGLLGKQPRLAHVMELVGEKSGWVSPLPAGHGRGLALMEGYGIYMAQVVELSVDNTLITVHSVVAVAVAGQLVNPDTVLAQIEGGSVFGLSAVLNGDITLDQGRVQQTNFHDYQVLRGGEIPKVEITQVNSRDKPGGMGEPATALIGPAVANTLFAATGKRLRELHLSEENLPWAVS